MTESARPALPVQERSRETRRRILEAAVTCLAEEGYSAATTSRIQQMAGVSRGSLLHQFPSREDLLVAAVQDLARRREGGIAEPEPGAPAGDIDSAVGLMWESFQGPLFRAAMQLWVASPHSTELTAALKPRERELGRRIREVIAEVFGPEHAAHPDFESLVTVINTSMRGVAMTYLFDPRPANDEPLLAVWRSIAHRILDASA